MNSKIVVVGSMNTDLTIKMEKFPAHGETILAGNYTTTQGGKGANQAVAAAKTGGEVIFIAKAGSDDFGKNAIEGYNKAGVCVEHILIDNNGKTGLAMIWVDAKGENSIVVSPGANNNLSPEDIKSKTDIIKASKILVVQLEIPIETVRQAVEIANANGVKVILNPAPAREIPADILNKIDIITPNQVELQSLTGIRIETEENIKSAAECLREKGIKTVVVTCGKRGSYILDDEGFEHISPFVVEAVDTTAAGDVLNGTLASALVSGQPIRKALVFANAAAAISVTKAGAQSSAPGKDQVDRFLIERLVFSSN